MSVNLVNALTPLNQVSGKPMQDSGGGDSKIRSLENQLERLKGEKKKASEAGNQERARQIEKQIQEIQRQIAQLRKKQDIQEQAGKQETKGAASRVRLKDPEVGNYIDESV